MIRWLVRIHVIEDKKISSKSVVIYGAGQAGLQLHGSLLQSGFFNVTAFVDDDPNLQGRLVQGVSIYSPLELSKLRQKFDLQLVILALPSESHHRRREILEFLRPLKVSVQVLPTLDQLISDVATANR